MIFIEEWPEKKALHFGEKGRFKWNSQKNIYKRFRNSGKQIYLLITNAMYLDQMDIIMCGEYPGKLLGQKVFVQGSNVVIAWWCEEWKS
jgi:hypothetical protein